MDSDGFFAAIIVFIRGCRVNTNHQQVRSNA